MRAVSGLSRPGSVASPEAHRARPLSAAGEFAKVQACRRRGETVVRACKHISKARLICQSNVKRTLRRVRRVGTEIEAMRKLRHK